VLHGKKSAPKHAVGDILCGSQSSLHASQHCTHPNATIIVSEFVSRTEKMTARRPDGNEAE